MSEWTCPKCGSTEYESLIPKGAADAAETLRVQTDLYEYGEQMRLAGEASKRIRSCNNCSFEEEYDEGWGELESAWQ